MKRLERFTSRDLQLASDRKIDNIYPEHIRGLKEAKLVPIPKIPEVLMMKHLWRKDEKDKEKKSKKIRKLLTEEMYIWHWVLQFFANLPEPLHKAINKIIDINDDFLFVEVAEGTVLRFQRQAVVSVVPKGTIGDVDKARK